MMNYLNLGCGCHFHSEWTNVDFTPTGQGVIAHDLNQGVPFPDASFEVVYHSHVLEHFPANKAQSFLAECYRVLSPNGVLRISVPDFEQIVRTYLTALEEASAGSEDWAANYEWILLEIYDQAVRDQPGGAMATYLAHEKLNNIQFILKRCGTEAKNLIEIAHLSRGNSKITNSLKERSQFLQPLRHFLHYFQYPRETLLKLILGREYSALQIGRFRQSGEVHQWMYDRYSLAKLLEDCGFQQIVQRTAAESYIPNWPDFNLDTELDGSVYKPDSLFMEAIKPE